MKKIYTIVLIISIILTFILTKTICTKTKIVYKEKNTKEEVKINNMKDIRKYENIVFLGDSITDFYPIDNIFIDLPIVNSGVNGYTTEDILERMDSMVYQYNPTKVFLLIGTNDIMYEKDKADNTVNNIKKIVNNINKNRKNTKVYIESIYPVRKQSNPGMVKDRDNNIIKEMNEKIKDYCLNNDKAEYINMYDQLKDENEEFATIYSDDGLHPNDLGYAKISQVRLHYIYDIDYN